MSAKEIHPSEISATGPSSPWQTSEGPSKKGSITSHATGDAYGTSGQQTVYHTHYYANVNQLASASPKEAKRSLLNSIGPGDEKQNNRFMSITTAASPTATIKMSMDGAQNFSNFAQNVEQRPSVRNSVSKNSIVQRYQNGQASSPTPGAAPAPQAYYPVPEAPYQNGRPSSAQRINVVSPQTQGQPGFQSQKSLKAVVSPAPSHNPSNSQAQHIASNLIPAQGSAGQVVNFKVPQNVYQQMSRYTSPAPMQRPQTGSSSALPQPALLKSPSYARTESAAVRQVGGASNIYAAKSKALSVVNRPEGGRSSQPASSRTNLHAASAQRSPDPQYSMVEKRSTETSRNVTIVETSTTKNFRESKVLRPNLSSVRVPVKTSFVQERAVITEKIIDKPIDVIIEKPVAVYREVKVPVNVLVENHVDKVIRRDVITEITVDRPVERRQEVFVDQVVEVPYEKIVEVPVYTQKVVEVPREVLVDKFVDRVIENRIYSDTVVDVDEEQYALIPQGYSGSPGLKMVEREVSRHEARSPSRSQYGAETVTVQHNHKTVKPSSFNFIGSSRIVHDVKSSRFVNHQEGRRSAHSQSLNNQCSLSAPELDAAQGFPAQPSPLYAQNNQPGAFPAAYQTRETAVAYGGPPQHTPLHGQDARNATAFSVSVPAQGQEAGVMARRPSHSALSANNARVAEQSNAYSQQSNWVSAPQGFAPAPHSLQGPAVYSNQQTFATAQQNGFAGNAVLYGSQFAQAPFAYGALTTNHNVVHPPPQTFPGYAERGESSAGRQGGAQQAGAAGGEYGQGSYYERSFATGIATMPHNSSSNQIVFSSPSINQVTLQPFPAGNGAAAQTANSSEAKSNNRSLQASAQRQQASATSSHAAHYEGVQITAYSPAEQFTPDKGAENAQAHYAQSEFSQSKAASLHNHQASARQEDSAAQRYNSNSTGRYSHGRTTNEKNYEVHVNQIDANFAQQSASVAAQQTYSQAGNIEFVSVQRNVQIHQIIENPVFREVVIEKPIYIEKVIEKEVIVPVERIIPVEVEKVIEVPIDIIVDNPIIKKRIVERERIIERKVPNMSISPKMSLNASLVNENSKLESRIQQMKSELTVLKSFVQGKSQIPENHPSHLLQKENKF